VLPTIEDIAVKTIVSVDINVPLKEAIKIMASSNHRNLVVVEKISEQKTKVTTEQDLIKILESNGFKANDISGQGKVDLSLADWYYGKKDELLFCYKIKKDGNIFFGRRTIRVRNPDYFSKYGISEVEDVAMRTYNFKFPLEGEGKISCENAITEYIDNLIPKKKLETPDENVLNQYIKDIKTNIVTPKDDRYTRIIQTGINQTRDDISTLPQESQPKFTELLGKVINDAKSAGYEVA
jgi:hypothetical protein